MSTTTDLLDLRGIAQRSSTFRFDLHDVDGRNIGTVHPDRERPPVVSVDGQRDIVRTLNGLLLPPSEARAVNPISDRVRPWMVLENGDERPMGRFSFADPSSSIESYGQPLVSSMVDDSIRFRQAITRSVGVSPPREWWTEGALQQPLRDTILQVLAEVGVTDVIVEDSGVQVLEPVAWSAGTSIARILGSLCELGGYYPPYFDLNGVCRVRQVEDLRTADPSLTYEAGRNVYRSPVETSDLIDAPNRFIVVDNGSPDTAIVGVYDLPAGAPHSVQARGFAVTQVEHVQGLGVSTNPNEVARSYATKHGVFEHVTFEGPPDPRHDVWDVLMFLDEPWLELGWSMTLREGAPMRHTLRRPAWPGDEAPVFSPGPSLNPLPPEPDDLVGFDAAVLALTPVGYWLLDEEAGSTAADSSGNSHDGTYTLGADGVLAGGTIGGEPAFQTGDLSIDPGTAFVEVPDHSDFSPQAGSSGLLTLVGWARLEVPWFSAAPTTFITKGDGTDPTAGEWWFGGSGGGIIEDGVGPVVDRGGPTTLQPGGWYLVGLTFDRSAEEFLYYVNGVAIDVPPGPFTGDSTDTALDVFIGAWGPTGAVDNINGYLSRWAIFDAALSDVQHAALYAAAFA